MKISLCFILTLFLIPLVAQGQIYIPGPLISSSTFTFDISDPLTKLHGSIDTTGMGTWKIGNTHKPFFSTPDTPSSAIMTNLVDSYYVNTDNSFVVTVGAGMFNPIITFKHKYQTTAKKDGGIIEFSAAGGAWQNIQGYCTGTGYLGLNTENVYGRNDTLDTGEPAFSGTSNGWVTSSLQFFDKLPVKGAQFCNFSNLKLRFRFKSDGIAENKDGWLIDSLQLKQYQYPSGVEEKLVRNLNVYPNPSFDGIFHFPVLKDQQEYVITVSNMFGQTVMELPYTQGLNLGGAGKGWYFYKASNGQTQYAGKLFVE